MPEQSAQREERDRGREVAVGLQLFASISDHVRTAIVAESVDRTILAVNQTFCDLFAGGASPAALAGADCSGVAERAKHLMREPEAFSRRVLHILAEGRPVAAEEVAFADGRVFERDYIPTRSEGRLLAHVWQYRDVTERRVTEVALRHSEERYRSLVANIPDVTWTADAAGRAVFISANVEQVYGFTREEIYRDGERLWFSRIHPDDVERVRLAYDRLFSHGERFDVEYRILHKNGEWIWWHDRAVGTYVVDGVACTDGLLSDVTARKRAEEALERSEAQLRRLVDANPLGIFFSDFSGAVTDANDAFLRLVGYTREELRAGELNWKAITPPEHLTANERANEEARVRGVYEPFEKEYVRRDGTRVPVLVGGVVFEGARESGYGIDFVLDLTGRKGTEAALRESEARYRSMFESDLTGNYISTPDGRLLACNETFARMYGFSSVEEALACDTRTLYASPETRDAFLELLRRERRLTRHEFEVRRRDGQTLHTVDFVEGVFDDAGKLVEMRGSCFDDTQRKLLEDQLRQSQKMEAVGRLAGGVAHDFNNLLTVITGYSELMVKRLSPSDPLHDSAAEIRNAAERAAGLTRQLLAFSRKQMLRPRVLSLNALVANLERMLRRLIGEDVELVTELDPALPNVEADPGQLEQVIANLVVNARDAMPHGGRLTIATSPAMLPCATGRPDGSGSSLGVALTVSDTGTGMGDETRSHIFEPFFTTKEQGKGTGLGLATVYGIVRQSRGSVEVESEPGRGATFRVYLPAVEATAHPSSSGADPERGRGGDETVLLVEDEDGVRKLAAAALRQFGYTVLEARGGGEALLSSEQYEGTIHLIVSDVVMPQMNGRAVVERVQAMRPGIKALFMSGYTDDDVLKRGVSEERAMFLAKPFTPDDLARKVREVLDGE